MNDDYDDIENYSWATFKVKTIRLIDSILVSQNSTIKVELIVSEDATETDVSIAFEKIHFWFNTIMSHSILFNRDNPIAVEMLFDENGIPRTDNFPMILSEEPTDDYLAVVLHSKLNALAGPLIAFGVLEIQSDTRELLTFTYTGYGEFELPDMAEWVGERTYHSKPWWARDDGSTMDVIPAEDADLSNPPLLGMDISFIEAKFKRPALSEPVIVRPQFKPEVISGGKDEPPKN